MSSASPIIPSSLEAKHSTAIPRVDEELSDRIAIARLFLILGIVILHVPPHQTLAELGSAPMEVIKAFFSGALFRVALPLLTMISAYLLFCRDRPPYSVLVKKKAASLLVPLIVWNAPVAIAVYLSQRYQLGSHSFSAELHPAHLTTWVNAIGAVSSSPINFPLYFLRDLFVLALLSPVFAFLYRRAPVIGLLAVGAVALSGIDGPVILRNDLLIAFYFGGLVATKGINPKMLDKHAWICSLTLFALCLFIISLDIRTGPLIRLPAALLMWSALYLICESRFGELLKRYSDASFLIFLTHAPLLVAFWSIYKMFFSYVPYPLFWLLAPIACALTGIFANEALLRFAPRFRSVVAGGR